MLFSFAAVGFIQLIESKSLYRVDKNIIVLDIFTITMYIFFELYIVNYRAILMNGYLEASYPSSHTMMVVCFMAVVIIECGILIKNKKLTQLLMLF